MSLLLSLHLLTASPETPEAASVRWALSMIESGGNDQAVGDAGERGRYQITPVNWCIAVGNLRYFSEHAEFEPNAWAVAKHHILREWHGVGHELTPACLYALYHRPTKLRNANGKLGTLTRAEQDRCRRFANLYAKRLGELTPK